MTYGLAPQSYDPKGLGVSLDLLDIRYPYYLRISSLVNGSGSRWPLSFLS